MELYAFSGKLGSGKNHVAEKIFYPMLPPKNTLIMAFADHIKVDLCIKMKSPYERFFGTKDNHSRKLLQAHGTESRNLFGSDIWVNTLAIWIKVYQARGIERIIITDLRYKNEADWVKANSGIIIRIEAPERHSKRMLTEQHSHHSQHESETDLDDFTEFDLVIQNDNQDDEEIIEQLEKIIKVDQ